MKTILMTAVIMSIGTSSVMLPLTAILSQDGVPGQSQPPFRSLCRKLDRKHLHP